MYKEIEEKIFTPNFEREVGYGIKGDEKIEKAINAASGNLKHEGIILTEREKELLTMYAYGEISEKEYKEIVVREAIK